MKPSKRILEILNDTQYNTSSPIWSERRLMAIEIFLDEEYDKKQKNSWALFNLKDGHIECVKSDGSGKEIELN